MLITREQILAVICDCVRRLGEEVGSDVLARPEEDTPLMGENSGVDSIALVSLIVEIESRLSEEFEMDLVLADDRAMSSARSPFRRVGILTDHVLELVRERSE